jgi:hypothetical protein
MKLRLALFSMVPILLSIIIVAGCATTAAKPPTPIEQGIFTTITNTVVVEKPVITPVYVTNSVGVAQVIWQTNTVTMTNVGYTMTVSPATQATIQTGATLVNTFAPGIGSMVGAAILALLGGLGWLRSSKIGAGQATTAAALAQEVETLRAFIKSVPNGEKYDQMIVSWLQAHQMEAGVASQVLTLLSDKVSNPEAKAAVDAILASYANLTKPTP